MPKLENAKHEKFCKELLKRSFNQTQAYMASYPDSSNEAAQSSACDLMRNPKVQSRIAELTKKIDEKDLVSIEEIVNDSKRIKLMALDEGDLNNALKANDQLYKYKGAYQNNTEVTVKHKTIEEVLMEAKYERQKREEAKKL